MAYRPTFADRQRTKRGVILQQLKPAKNPDAVFASDPYLVYEVDTMTAVESQGTYEAAENAASVLNRQSQTYNLGSRYKFIYRGKD